MAYDDQVLMDICIEKEEDEANWKAKRYLDKAPDEFEKLLADVGFGLEDPEVRTLALLASGKLTEAHQYLMQSLTKHRVQKRYDLAIDCPSEAV